MTEQLAPPTSVTRTNGRDSLGIAVTATPDGNAVAISHDIRDRLAELEAASGAELTVVFDQAPFVEESIESLTTEGLLGLVMAVIVILVFLVSVRSTLVTSVSIPLSVLVALLALWSGEYSLNLLTLGALTIAVGRWWTTRSWCWRTSNATWSTASRNAGRSSPPCGRSPAR